MNEIAKEYLFIFFTNNGNFKIYKVCREKVFNLSLMNIMNECLNEWQNQIKKKKNEWMENEKLMNITIIIIFFLWFGERCKCKITHFDGKKNKIAMNEYTQIEVNQTKSKYNH